MKLLKRGYFLALIFFLSSVELGGSNKKDNLTEPQVVLEHVFSEYLPIFFVNKYYIFHKYFKKHRDFFRKQDENYVEHIFNHNRVVISTVCKLRLINTRINYFIENNNALFNCLTDYLVHFNCIRRRINEPVDCEKKELSPFFQKSAAVLWHLFVPCLMYLCTRPIDQLSTYAQRLPDSNIFYVAKYPAGTLFACGLIDTIVQSTSSNSEKIVRNPIENTFRLINTFLDFFKQKKQISNLYSNIDDFKFLKRLLCEIYRKNAVKMYLIARWDRESKNIIINTPLENIVFNNMPLISFPHENFLGLRINQLTPLKHTGITIPFDCILQVDYTKMLYIKAFDQEMLDLHDGKCQNIAKYILASIKNHQKTLINFYSKKIHYCSDRKRSLLLYIVGLIHDQYPITITYRAKKSFFLDLETIIKNPHEKTGVFIKNLLKMPINIKIKDNLFQAIPVKNCKPEMLLYAYDLPHTNIYKKEIIEILKNESYV